MHCIFMWFTFLFKPYLQHFRVLYLLSYKLMGKIFSLEFEF